MFEPGQARDQLPQRTDIFFAPATTETLFWRPRFIADTPLMQHVPFLFWLVGAVRPRNIAVCGSGKGVAPFALCQALDKLNIAGRCLGIGFWSDPDTGQAEVPPALRDHASQLYDDILYWRSAESVRQALTGIAPGSLDLLFIDACDLPKGDALPRTGEWRGVMRPDGVIVVHGELPSEGGEDALRALSAGRSVISFPDGQGLVVLPLGDNPPARLSALLKICDQTSVPGEIGLFFRRLGQGHLAVAGQIGAAEENRRLAASLETMQQELDKARQDAAAARAELQRERDTRFHETAALTRQLEPMRQAKQQAEAQKDALATQVKTLQADIARLKGAEAALTQRVTDLMNSTSWRVTAPMRRVKTALSGH